MNDEKVSVKEALDKLYDLSWMIGSTSMEYLTDKDGEKIRDYIEIIENRIHDLEENHQTVIENGQALARGMRAGAGVIDPKIVESINQVGLPNVLSDEEIKDVLKNSR